MLDDCIQEDSMMKIRWLTLFFLFGALGTVAVGLFIKLTTPTYYSTQSSVEVSSPPLPAGLPPSLPRQIFSAEQAIANTLEQLPEGQVYHNVPEKMKVGIPQMIEAGIAPEVTEQIQQKIQGQGEIEIESGIRFDPTGTEMQLIVKPDEFDVFEVRGGEQFVTSQTPGRWLWQVTPLEAGDQFIVIKAIVTLNIPELNLTRPVTVEVFSAIRTVEINPVYSTYQFVSQNWQEVIGLIIGSGSLASLVTWWLNRREQKQLENPSD
jgi:hypothetical protein